MGTQALKITEIHGNVGMSDSARVIRNSFRTVAKEFNLTRENCPTHPSFITVRQLTELKEKRVNLFGGIIRETQVGFVALEKAEEALYYMEKLAVLPDYRHHGYGQKLVEFAVEYARNHNGKKISIGTIDEHTILKDWYKTLGFKEVSTRKFNHLPFTVCYMEIEIPKYHL